MSRRNEKFDFYKGMLIIGVILGHTVTALKGTAEITIWLCTFLRTFDMPMFAFVTGIFLKKSMEKHTVSENLKNKCCHILWPVFLWTMLLNVVTHNRNVYYWYLWSIFFCCVFMILAGAVCKTRKQLFPVVLLLCCLVLHCGVGERVNVGFLFFPCMVGYYYDALKIRGEKAGRIGKALVLLMFAILLYFWKPEYSVWTVGCNVLQSLLGTKGIWLMVFRGCIGLVGIFSMMIVYGAVYDVLQRGRGRRISQYIAEIGRHTLEIYILQTICVELALGKIVLAVAAKLGGNPFAASPILMGYLYAPVIAVLAAAILNEIQKIIKRIPFIGTYLFDMNIPRKQKERMP